MYVSNYIISHDLDDDNDGELTPYIDTFMHFRWTPTVRATWSDIFLREFAVTTDNNVMPSFMQASFYL